MEFIIYSLDYSTARQKTLPKMKTNFFESNALFSTFSGKNAYGQNLSGINEKWSVLSEDALSIFLNLHF